MTVISSKNADEKCGRPTRKLYAPKPAFVKRLRSEKRSKTQLQKFSRVMIGTKRGKIEDRGLQTSYPCSSSSRCIGSITAASAGEILKWRLSNESEPYMKAP